jgi:thioredoxin-like negative regulator of GroEL
MHPDLPPGQDLSEKTFLLFFWAPWDGNSKRYYEQVLVDALPAYAGQFTFYPVNIDPVENHNLCHQVHLQNTPTLILFVDGKVREQSVGIRSRETLDTLLRKWLAEAATD